MTAPTSSDEPDRKQSRPGCLGNSRQSSTIIIFLRSEFLPSSCRAATNDGGQRCREGSQKRNDELYVRSTNLRQLAVSAGSYRVLPCALGYCALVASPTHAFWLTWLVLSQGLILRHFTRESPSTTSKLANGLDKYYLYPAAWIDTMVRRVKCERPGLGLSRDRWISPERTIAFLGCLSAGLLTGGRHDWTGAEVQQKARHPDTSWSALHRNSFVLAETGRAGEQDGRKGSARLVTCCP